MLIWSRTSMYNWWQCFWEIRNDSVEWPSQCSHIKHTSVYCATPKTQTGTMLCSKYYWISSLKVDFWRPDGDKWFSKQRTGFTHMGSLQTAELWYRTAISKFQRPLPYTLSATTLPSHSEEPELSFHSRPSIPVTILTPPLCLCFISHNFRFILSIIACTLLRVSKLFSKGQDSKYSGLQVRWPWWQLLKSTSLEQTPLPRAKGKWMDSAGL